MKRTAIIVLSTVVISLGYAQSNHTLQGPVYKNASPAEKYHIDALPIASLHINKLKGPTFKNDDLRFIVSNDSQNIIITTNAITRKTGPKAKNHRPEFPATRFPPG